jgi:hypothetical protein
VGGKAIAGGEWMDKNIWKDMGEEARNEGGEEGKIGEGGRGGNKKGRGRRKGRMREDEGGYVPGLLGGNC